MIFQKSGFPANHAVNSQFQPVFAALRPSRAPVDLISDVESKQFLQIDQCVAMFG